MKYTMLVASRAAKAAANHHRWRTNLCMKKEEIESATKQSWTLQGAKPAKPQWQNRCRPVAKAQQGRNTLI